MRFTGRTAPRLWQGRFASVVGKKNFMTMNERPELAGSQLHVQAAIDELSKDLILNLTGHRTDGKQLTFLSRNFNQRDA